MYGEGDVRAFLRANEARYLADGLPLPEVHRAQATLQDWRDWWPHWMDRSRWFEERTQQSETSSATRQTLLVYASLTAHLAQYLHFHDEERRARALRRKIDTYSRALEYMSPVGEHLAVPFEGTTLSAIVRRPSGRDRVGGACVIYVGGLDAHKEDAHTFMELCLQRGLSVVAFDGPGQGEARLEGLMLDPTSHLGISAVIDALADLPYVDPRRIGVIGRSLGGYLAPRAAADDKRIAALCVWGAMYHLDMLRGLPRHTQQGFCHVTGADDLDEAARRLRFVNMHGVADRVSCPSLIIHGADDALTPVTHARRLAADIGESCELRVIPGSGHCNHDAAHVVRLAMADWLAYMLTPQAEKFGLVR